MADSVNEAYNKALQDWLERLFTKTNNIITNADKGIVKAALFAEGEAKKNAQLRIYSQPVPTNKKGKELYVRTSAYKASIGSGLNPDKAHCAIVYATVKYAPILEYGSSKGRRGKYILSDAVIKNKEKIRQIIKSTIKVGK